MHMDQLDFDPLVPVNFRSFHGLGKENPCDKNRCLRTFPYHNGLADAEITILLEEYRYLDFSQANVGRTV